MATEQVRVVKIDTNPAQTSVKDLRNELKELRNTMLSCEQGTEEYNAALVQAAEIQHTLKEQMQQVNAVAMDFGQISQNTVSAIGGVVAGFQAATAVMNLFGTENEDVIKTLKTMQQLMSITQALPSIEKGIKAFRDLGTAIKASSTALKGLSTAAISTGIGALVVALGLLIANWDKVTDAMKRWGIIHEDTAKKLEEERKKIEEVSKAYSDWQAKIRQEERNDKISKLNENAKKSFDELEQKIKELSKQETDLRFQADIAWRTQGKAAGDVLKEQADAIKNQTDLLKNQQKAILENAESYKELPKKAVEATKKTVSELEILLWEAGQMLSPKSLQDELLIKLGGMPLTIPVKPEFVEEDEEEDTSFEDSFRDKIERTLEGLRAAFGTSEEEQYQLELNALDVALNTKLIKEEEYYKLRDALNKEYTQREIQRYAIAAQGIGSIFNSLGDMMEEGSKEQKALQIMGATINMLGGITAAVAGAFTTHSGPWDIALAVIQAAAIAATGAATIAKMSKTNKNNASSSAGASINTSALNSVIAPVQYTQDVQGASIEGAIKDTKVYVTETDITNTQNKVEVSESEARF